MELRYMLSGPGQALGAPVVLGKAALEALASFPASSQGQACSRLGLSRLWLGLALGLFLLLGLLCSRLGLCRSLSATLRDIACPITTHERLPTLEAGQRVAFLRLKLKADAFEWQPTDPNVLYPCCNQVAID